MSKLPPELHRYAGVFSKAATKILPPFRPGYDHVIDLLPSCKLPRKQPMRRYSDDKLSLIKEFIHKGLRTGELKPSTTDVVSELHLAKKGDARVRVCPDYRELNNCQPKKRYTLPRIDETIARLRKGKFTSKIDLQKAFHRLRMDPTSEDFTTFTSRFGNYKFKVMPFGLCNAPADFQRFVNNQFLDYLGDWLDIYLDDFWISSDTYKDYIKHLELLFERLRSLELYADINKSEFLTDYVSFLGLMITAEGVEMDPRRIETVANWPRLQTPKEVRKFLGFIGYYRRFIKDYSQKARPLHQLLTKGAAL